MLMVLYSPMISEEETELDEEEEEEAEILTLPEEEEEEEDELEEDSVVVLDISTMKVSCISRRSENWRRLKVS